VSDSLFITVKDDDGWAYTELNVQGLPIETVPRDGSYILLYFESIKWTKGAFGPDGIWYCEAEWVPGDGPEPDELPTHWLPFPKDP
jgi:hypothetical protein